ncbi:MAG: 7-carboxy-7-deazaguanine synthase QueE [Akkermansiaceae bacterium]
MAEPLLKLARLHDGPEIFHTIQGEGVSMGVPSVFIRSSLCNLHCKWCDTDYTWNWEGTPWEHEKDSDPSYRKFRKADYITELTVSDAAQHIANYQCFNVILTGGEPLIQEDAWLALMLCLREKNTDYRFEIETNGTLKPGKDFDAAVDQYNVSPKLANSGNSVSQRCKADALAFFAQSPKAWFKFVIAEESDLSEVHQLIHQHSIPQGKVLLMPEGRDEATLEKKRLWLADICRSQNFRYSDRLHIQLWGSKRGV